MCWIHRLPTSNPVNPYMYHIYQRYKKGWKHAEKSGPFLHKTANSPVLLCPWTAQWSINVHHLQHWKSVKCVGILWCVSDIHKFIYIFLECKIHICYLYFCIVSRSSAFDGGYDNRLYSMPQTSPKGRQNKHPFSYLQTGTW